jgi:hypothetical protein
MSQSHVMSFRDAETGQVQNLDTYNNTLTMTDPNGRLVKMDVNVNDVHTDRAIANYAAGFRLANGVADFAAPVVPVDGQSNKYWTWDKLDAFQQVESLIAAPGATVREIAPRLSNSSYTCNPYALGAFVPTELEANADSPLQVRMAHMNRVMNALMLGREVRVANALRAPGSYGASFKSTLAAGAKWNGGASSDPTADLFGLIESALMPITDLIMSERTWHAFARNAAVQKYTGFKTQVPGIPTVPSDGSSNGNANSFSAILGLPNIHIASMKYLDATGAYSYVWGNDVVAIHRPSSLMPTDGRDIATAYTFRWNGGNVGDASADGGFVVRSFFNPNRGPRGGTQIVVAHNDAEVFIQDSVSGLIINAWQ